MPKFTFLWCLSVVASLNYFSQFSHKSKSSVNWHLMVSQFTWNIKSFVTLITIKINCDNCDTRFNDSGKLRHHKVSLHGFSCDNCYKLFNEGANLWHCKVSVHEGWLRHVTFVTHNSKEYQTRRNTSIFLFCRTENRLHHNLKQKCTINICWH